MCGGGPKINAYGFIIRVVNGPLSVSHEDPMQNSSCRIGKIKLSKGIQCKAAYLGFIAGKMKNLMQPKWKYTQNTLAGY